MSDEDTAVNLINLTFNLDDFLIPDGIKPRITLTLAPVVYTVPAAKK